MRFKTGEEEAMKKQNTINILTILENLLCTVQEQYWSSRLSDFKLILVKNRLSRKRYLNWKKILWGEAGFLDLRINTNGHTEETNRILNNLKYGLFKSWSEEIAPGFRKNKSNNKKGGPKC